MITPNLSHLNALQSRLSNEKARFAAEANPKAKLLRTVWISQIEKEIAAEYEFLGIEPPSLEITDEDTDLIAELGL